MIFWIIILLDYLGPLFSCIKAGTEKVIQAEMSASCGFEFCNLAFSGMLVVIIATIMYLSARYHDKLLKLHLI